MPLKKEPLIVSCFKCNKNLVVKFVPPRKDYSQKNNWGYWTERNEDLTKYVCWECISKMYYQERSWLLEQIQSERKKKLIRCYLSIMNNGLQTLGRFG